MWVDCYSSKFEQALSTTVINIIAFGFNLPDGGPFKASLNTAMFCNFDFLKANVAQPTIQVADARSPGRFFGTETEPRPNFPTGHIPHSKNVHYAQCLDPQTKLMKDPEHLKKVFERAGIDLSS